MLQRVNTKSLLCSLVFILVGFSASRAAQSSQSATPKVELNVERILVPVVVRDAQGRSVNGLKEADFTIFDNGKPHAISGFTIETQGAGPGTANMANGAAETVSSSAAIPSPSPGAPGRITVFVFDDLHLKVEDLARVKSAAAVALDGALSGSDEADVVSISGKTNSGLTRDRATLEAAIAGIQPNPTYRIDSSQCGAIDYYQANLIENLRDQGALDDALKRMALCNPSVQLDNGDRPMAEGQVESAARRALQLGELDVRETFATVAEMVRRLATQPGQKLLVLVSPGFLNIQIQSMAAESQILDLAAQSGVTISALDARGLYTDQISASERGPGAGGPNPGFRRTEMKLAMDPMAELADGTGGTFFENNNDLAAGFKLLTAAPETVYLLELPFEKGKPDGRYHTLKVKVDRDGLELQARRGYFWSKPEKKQ
jgi:VWFA-related protein